MMEKWYVILYHAVNEVTVEIFDSGDEAVERVLSSYCHKWHLIKGVEMKLTPCPAGEEE